MYKRVFSIILTVFFLLPVGIILAQREARQVTDETVHGDVTLINEDLDLTETGEVKGSVTILNGDAVIAGTITQDLVVFNGDVVLAETAVIQGACVTINGSFSGSSPDLLCREINQFPLVANIIDSPEGPLTPIIEPSFNPSVLRLSGAVSLSIVMGLLAMGVYALAPTSTQRIELAMKERPFASAAVGLLSFGAIPFLNLVLLVISIPLLFVCIGLLGFPLILGLSLGFMVAGIWAWVLWGKLFGDWVTSRLHWHPNHTAVVAVGTAVLTFIFFFIAFSGPGWAIMIGLLSLLPLAWGMGATALTRFGTRTYPLLKVPSPTPEKILAVLETLPDESA